MTLDTIIIQSLINGLLIGFIYSLIALGLTLIWGTMEIVNFAHGDFLMLSMYVTFWIFTIGRVDPILSLPIILIIFFIIGLIYYKVLLKVLQTRQIFSKVLATVGFGSALQSIAIFFWKPDYRLIRGHKLSGSIRFSDISIGIPQLVMSIICVISIFLLFYFLNRTKIGRAIKATTLNKDAAALVGINTEQINFIVVGIGISLVGLAGNLLSNFYYIFPQVGFNFSILAYIVVCIGGFGSIYGALIGGILLGLTSSIVGVFFNPAYKYAFVFMAYLLIIFIKPKGLKGW